MPKYPNNRILLGFGYKSGFSTNFCPYYSMAMWRLWAKKLTNTISAEFGVFPSKNHDSIVFYAILLVTFRENHKKQKITIIRYFILFFAFFSKTVGMSSVFNAEMNSTCQNTLITAFLWDLEKKAVFFSEFLPLLQYGDVEAMGQKIDQYHFGPNLASIHLKTMIPLFLCNSASNFQRKFTKNRK